MKTSRSAAVFTLIVGALLIAYPLLLRKALGIAAPATVAGVFFILLLCRLLIMRKACTALEIILSAFICGNLALAWLLDAKTCLLLHPALASAAVCIAFLCSLFRPPSIIERFARMHRQIITPGIERYCRNVSWIWAAALAGNSAVSAYTACAASLKLWEEYNGVISYLLFGVLLIGEIIVRRLKEPDFQSELDGLREINNLSTR